MPVHACSPAGAFCWSRALCGIAGAPIVAVFFILGYLKSAIASGACPRLAGAGIEICSGDLRSPRNPPGFIPGLFISAFLPVILISLGGRSAVAQSWRVTLRLLFLAK